MAFLTQPTFEPRNGAQRAAQAAWRRNQVLFLSGQAGTGKTYTAAALAMGELARSKGAGRLYLCRPAVEAGESLGYLPGDQREKTLPFAVPFEEALSKLGYNPERLRRDGQYETVPLAYLQGRTFDGVAVLDEAQNCSAAQVRMFLSRMGEGSKLLIAGDPDQHFARTRNDFPEVLDRVKDIPGVAVVHASPSDTVRHPLVADFLKALEGL